MSPPRVPDPPLPPKRPSRRTEGLSKVSLISRWYLRPGNEETGWAALRKLAQAVYDQEPETLTYLVHAPDLSESRLESLPPIDPISVEFFETYRNADAFLAHVNGPVFKKFVQEHGALFVGPGNPDDPADPLNQHPFTTVEFLTLQAGFSRPGTTPAAPSGLAAPGPNQHPAVMFEIMANDQVNLSSFYSKVFGWQVEPDSAGFDLIPFPAQFRPSLGGIGAAQPGVPGYEKGITFYLEADDLEARLALIVQNGGTQVGDITTLDGYTFVNFTDPEGNLIGMIKPFS